MEPPYKKRKVNDENSIPCPPAPRKDCEQLFNGYVWVIINKDCYTILPKKSFGKENN